MPRAGNQLADYMGRLAARLQQQVDISDLAVYPPACSVERPPAQLVLLRPASGADEDT